MVLGMSMFQGKSMKRSEGRLKFLEKEGSKK